MLSIRLQTIGLPQKKIPDILIYVTCILIQWVPSPSSCIYIYIYIHRYIYTYIYTFIHILGWLAKLFLVSYPHLKNCFISKTCTIWGPSEMKFVWIRGIEYESDIVSTLKPPALQWWPLGRHRSTQDAPRKKPWWMEAPDGKRWLQPGKRSPWVRGHWKAWGAVPKLHPNPFQGKRTQFS